jgi:hypothetical protein
LKGAVLYTLSDQGYKRLVLDVLMEGKNCAGLEFSEFGEEVKQWYKGEFVKRCGDA